MYTPAVFAAGSNYEIFFPAEEPSILWIRIGDREFADDACGLYRSDTDMHRVSVPQEILDAARSYTVCTRKVIERRSNGSILEDTVETEYAFRPVPKGSCRAYHISDAHNKADGPIAAARAFGPIDFLIVNGDLAGHSRDRTIVDVTYTIISEITHGEIPVVYARGNHDTRGAFAEKLGDYFPFPNGKSYYTFRLGDLWGIVLDTGEDKPDDHIEYGGTACFHAFRLAETDFIRRAAASGEANAPDIRRRLVIVHNPFTEVLKPPFNIELDLFSEWARILREEIHPDVMIAGHMHRLEVNSVGSARDHLGQCCPVVIGGKPENGFGGAGLSFEADGTFATFTDETGAILGERVPVI